MCLLAKGGSERGGAWPIYERTGSKKGGLKNAIPLGKINQYRLLKEQSKAG
jgi:hypothetical protein